MNNSKANYSSFFSQLSFLLVILLIGGVIFWQLKFFLSCFLGAITLYVVSRKPFFWLVHKKRFPLMLAALVMVAVLAIVILAFGTLSFNLIYAKVVNIDTANLMSGVKEVDDKLFTITGYHLISMDIINESKDMLLKIVSSLVNTTYGVIANAFMMFFVLYTMFANADYMEETVLKYTPIKGDDLKNVKLEFKNMIMSNAVGIPLVMILQGGVATLGYWIFGVNDFVFWGFFTGIFSIVPFVGTAIVWLPLSVNLIAMGNEPWSGVGLLIYSAVLITNIDNVVRMVVLKKMADTAPLITIFGVILGIPLFGFWGIIFGPLMISMFLLLIKMYYNHYSK